MSEQTLIQFRADKALKQEVSEIYRQLGLDLPTAFRMFMAKTKLERGLPFEANVITSQSKTEIEKEKAREEFRKVIEDIREHSKNLPEMTMEEIDAEIAAARAERRARMKV